MSSHKFLAVVVEAPDELAELVAAAAEEAGTLGCEVGDGWLKVFFDAVTGARLPLDFPAINGTRVRSRTWLEDQDWLAAYREGVSPIAVGDRFIVDPREVGAEPIVAEGRRVLRVPARRAFGTGGHESTRLALKLIEHLQLRQRRVLDFGIGSGILSFAAASLGAEHCAGVEHDLTSALVGAQNRSLQNCEWNCLRTVSFVAGSSGALKPLRHFDVLLINTRPINWLPHAASIAACLRPGAQVVHAGFLDSEATEVEGAWRDLGWAPVQSEREGEWKAMLLVGTE